jgi:hypothetical protein
VWKPRKKCGGALLQKTPEENKKTVERKKDFRAELEP